MARCLRSEQGRTGLADLVHEKEGGEEARNPGICSEHAVGRKPGASKDCEDADELHKPKARMNRSRGCRLASGEQEHQNEEPGQRKLQTIYSPESLASMAVADLIGEVGAIGGCRVADGGRLRMRDGVAKIQVRV